MEIIHRHFDIIDSTNTFGKLNCHLFPKGKVTLITANAQTGGRGRSNRKWVSPPNENIYATFCFEISTSRQDIGNIPQVLSLSAASLLKSLKLKPALKWPNDILLSDKKVGGILCETVSLGSNFMIVLGIGLNVNMPKETLEKIDRPATSIKNETGKIFEINPLIELLKTLFLTDLNTFLNSGFKPFLEDYRTLMWTNDHKQMSFHDNQELVKGTFHSINDDGTLNLTLENGHIKRFISGEFVSQ